MVNGCIVFIIIFLGDGLYHIVMVNESSIHCLSYDKSRDNQRLSYKEDNNTWQWLSYESSIHRAKEEISLKSLVFSFALIFNNLWKTKDSLSYNRS